MTKLTYQQKLDALSYRFYQGGVWTPKAGDFYTTSRADLELYQVVSVEGGVVRTRFTEGTDAISEWPEAGFLTEGFGPRRVFVPEWVICAPPSPETNVARLADRLRYEAEGMDMAMHGEEFGDTKHLQNWQDKPHRVVFDATKLLREAADALSAQEVSR
jgi:hypothetical protein